MGLFSVGDIARNICTCLTFEMEFLKNYFKKCYWQGFPLCFCHVADLEYVLLSSKDLEILSECQRKVLPGGLHRVFHIRTCLIWSMPMGSTSSAGTGNPLALPSKSLPDAGDLHTCLSSPCSFFCEAAVSTICFTCHFDIRFSCANKAGICTLSSF